MGEGNALNMFARPQRYTHINFCLSARKKPTSTYILIVSIAEICAFLSPSYPVNLLLTPSFFIVTFLLAYNRTGNRNAHVVHVPHLNWLDISL